MATEIRVLDSERDLVAAANLFRTSMIGFPPLADLAPGQITTLLERGRTVGAFVEDQLVGTADAVTSGLTLPGGTIVGHAAVTHVGVLPSFTRKGIATDLMRHQLHDVAARGETVATLRASEATIYERYGYGVASSSQTVEVHTARAELRPGLGAGGPVRLLDAERVWDVLPRIYTENRPSRPGTIDRPDVWWQGVRLRTESSPRPWYVAVHGEPGSETGFARYRPIDTEKWFVSDQRTIVVEDFFAPDTNTYLGLLRFLLGLDLIDRVMFWMLPVDDPLPWLLLDRRAARVTAAHDETWLRIVDVEKAWLQGNTRETAMLSSLSTTRYCPTIRSPSPSPETAPNKPTGPRNFALTWPAFPPCCSAARHGAVWPSPDWPARRIRQCSRRPSGCSRYVKHHTPDSSSKQHHFHVMPRSSLSCVAEKLLWPKLVANCFARSTR